MKKISFIGILICAFAFQSQAQIFLESLPNSSPQSSAQLAIDSIGRIYFCTKTFAIDSQYICRYNPQTTLNDTLLKIPLRAAGLELSTNDTTLYISHSARLWAFSLLTNRNRVLNNSIFYSTVLCLRKKTGDLYAIEGADNGRAAVVSKTDIRTGIRTKVAGGIPNTNAVTGYVNGIGDSARFSFIPPNGPFKNGGALAFSMDEDTLYIGDPFNRCIRKLNLITNEVSTFAGPLPDSVRVGFQDGFRYDARFNFISGLAVDSNGYVYVCDAGPGSRESNPGNRIRKISPGGQVRTIIGNGRGRGVDNFDNMDFTAGFHGTQALTGFLADIRFNNSRDTLYICQSQRITKANKRKSSLSFNNLQDRMVGSGKYGIRTLSNSAVPKIISTISLPANVSFSNDTVDVSPSAETGFVILKAQQKEDLDTIFTTTAVDTFSVIPFVSNKPFSKISLLAYPNPLRASEWLHIEGKNFPAGKTLIELRDALGRLLINEEILLNGQFLQHQIRMPEFAGLYWITLRIGNEVLKASIIKE